ncbi:PAAR domain-containing protein [Pseudomonas profundi]|uniref:PAAR domain-containing protein n=1 Tax=Pseudomonas profundi TaxID=1981513 RepID=UPI00123B1585|nr:PAAR domain-containing protein [Pseudomonas profundi]
MSGKPVARIGDMTECPKDKHGSNPITQGSPDVLIEGVPAARMGDPTACGSMLVGGVSGSVMINGKPAAVLGSTGNHGNAVVSGSTTVVIGK